MLAPLPRSTNYVALRTHGVAIRVRNCEDIRNGGCRRWYCTSANRKYSRDQIKINMYSVTERLDTRWSDEQHNDACHIMYSLSLRNVVDHNLCVLNQHSQTGSRGPTTQHCQTYVFFFRNNNFVDYYSKPCMNKKQILISPKIAQGEESIDFRIVSDNKQTNSMKHKTYVMIVHRCQLPDDRPQYEHHSI